MIPVIVYGVFLLSGVTVPFFLKWIKTKWYVNLIFFLLSLGLIIGNYLQEKQYSQYYDEISTPIEVDGNQYDKVIQYYNKKNKLIRRIGVELDGEKDSTWTTFDRNGEIISVEYYRNGSLIKR